MKNLDQTLNNLLDNVLFDIRGILAGDALEEALAALPQRTPSPDPWGEYQLWRIQVTEDPSSTALVYGTSEELEHSLYYNAFDVEMLDKYMTRRQARGAARWFATQDGLTADCVYDIEQIPDMV